MTEILEPILKQLRHGQRTIQVCGPGTSGKAFLILQICRETRRSALLLTASQEEAEVLASDMKFFIRTEGLETDVAIYPPLETPTAWSKTLRREMIGHRMQALHRVLTGKQVILTAPISAMPFPVPSPDWLRQSVLQVQAGDIIDRDDFINTLIRLGYERVPTVEQPGQVACRGGIIDLFAAAHSQPVRLELLGDSLESLRQFDSISQRSLNPIDQTIALPACEPPSARNPHHPLKTLSEYFRPDTLLVLDEPVKIRAVEEDPDTDPILTKAGQFFQQCIELHTLSVQTNQSHMIPVETQSPAAMGLGFRPASFSRAIDILRKHYRNKHIFIICHHPDQLRRMQEIFMEHALAAPSWTVAPLESVIRQPSTTLHLVTGHLSSGVIFQSMRLAFVTEEELFGKTPAPSVRRAKVRTFLTPFEDLKIHDYVVHIQYGIGRFQGLERILINHCETDFLVVSYAAGAKIYVPIEHLDLIQKYTAPEGVQPRIDSLGTASWNRTKQKVQKEIQEMARDLLDLYAEREVINGYSFSTDDLSSREFDATFEFEETPDQQRTIDEVKSDMESPRPMDRLICGDVGYGKTEIALRAAFKSAMENKQVAVLVPTTLLAQQHYQTFHERFAAFPLRVEMLSRFIKPKEQAAIIRDLAEGKVDVIIGTHRLAQKDIAFRNLGLVVIDEEQRFGVAHKERLKKMRKTVDVLTLTATPIPRTLQMSLMDIRDLSIIETPPPDRLAVKTIVARLDGKLIQEAIRRELRRKGQIFFVHYRVNGIEKIADFLKKLVPEATILIAHGQMKERQLEQVMNKFLRRECDLLLTTTIIESGLDIPSANTIMINRSDQFGLSELYQLRGRVGRSSSQAYAYLLVPDDAMMTEAARQRLTALQEFSELGSGFKIAARDLEIRGAGNLLGRAQSGHIASVGFDLYLSMIQQAVQKLRGQPPEEEINPTLNLRVSAYLPREYIQDSYQRLVLYKRLASLKDPDEISDIQGEMEDRFGPLPQTVEFFLQIIRIRILASSLKIERVESKPDHWMIAFHPSARLTEQAPDRLLEGHALKLRFLSDFSFRIDCRDDPWEQRYQFLQSILLQLRDIMSQPNRQLH